MDNNINKIILAEEDIGEFLCYCISWNFKATAINKLNAFGVRPRRFMFKLNRSLEEIDFKNIKRHAPSVEQYFL